MATFCRGHSRSHFTFTLYILCKLFCQTATSSKRGGMFGLANIPWPTQIRPCRCLPSPAIRQTATWCNQRNGVRVQSAHFSHKQHWACGLYSDLLAPHNINAHIFISRKTLMIKKEKKQTFQYFSRLFVWWIIKKLRGKKTGCEFIHPWSIKG